MAEDLSGAYLGTLGRSGRAVEAARGGGDDHPERRRGRAGGGTAVPGDQAARGRQVGRGVQGDDLGCALALELPLHQPGEGAGRRQLDHAGDAEVGQRSHAQVPADRRGHLPDQPPHRLRAVPGRRAVEVGQQDPGRSGGRDTGGHRGEGGLGGRHVRRVERARHLEPDDPGPGRRLGGQLVQRVDRAGGHDLTGPVAVGRVQPVRRERGDHLVRVTAEHGGHPGRLQRAGGGHLPPAYAGERHGGLGRQHPGQRGGAQLTDAVPGDQPDVVHGQVLGGEQRGGDQQRLGTGGVLDLVRVRPGAQVDQVHPGQRRPPAQTRLGAGEVEPRREEAGLLGTLSGREYGEHVYDSDGYRRAAL